MPSQTVRFSIIHRHGHMLSAGPGRFTGPDKIHPDVGGGSSAGLLTAASSDQPQTYQSLWPVPVAVMPPWESAAV